MGQNNLFVGQVGFLRALQLPLGLTSVPFRGINIERTVVFLLVRVNKTVDAVQKSMDSCDLKAVTFNILLCHSNFILIKKNDAKLLKATHPCFKLVVYSLNNLTFLLSIVLNI